MATENKRIFKQPVIVFNEYIKYIAEHVEICEDYYVLQNSRGISIITQPISIGMYWEYGCIITFIHIPHTFNMDIYIYIYIYTYIFVHITYGSKYMDINMIYVSSIYGWIFRYICGFENADESPVIFRPMWLIILG